MEKIIGLLIIGAVIGVFIAFLVWEWHLIRDVAIAFMPVSSAESLAWLGTIFSFGLGARTIQVKTNGD